MAPLRWYRFPSIADRRHRNRLPRRQTLQSAIDVSAMYGVGWRVNGSRYQALFINGERHLTFVQVVPNN